MNPMRTAKQGVQVNVGKFGDEYEAVVTTLSIHEEDMQALQIVEGDRVVARSEHGSAEFVCQAAKVPPGMVFVPYGPPTCKLMGGDTGGTGMPTSKGLEVEIQAVNAT